MQWDLPRGRAAGGGTHRRGEVSGAGGVQYPEESLRMQGAESRSGCYSGAGRLRPLIITKGEDANETDQILKRAPSN